MRVFGLGILLSLTSCGHHKVPEGPPPTPSEALQGLSERGGLVFEDDPWGDGATKVVYPDQGWGPAETLWYYFADQGSVLLPYELFVHLEQADNTRPFIEPAHLARFRFLAQHPTPNNPDGLPIGFARHDDSVGLTCAACHTGQLVYQGTALRVDGAPALADITGFNRALEAALRATREDPEKLGRLAAALPGPGDEAKKREEAAAMVETSLAWFESYNGVNDSPVVEGNGRVDAVVRLINQAIRFTSGPQNSLTPNAPASFPFLWDAPRHDYVQWAGFASNAGAGSLGRNAGEVVGVYGRVEVVPYTREEDGKKGYASTINLHELVSMEEALRGLESPQWPEDLLPPIDAALAREGEGLYRENCLSCHALIDRDDPDRAVTAMVMSVDTVGTDRVAATNLTTAVVPTGILEGALSLKGERYGATLPGLALLGDVAGRSLAAHPDAALRAVANAKLAGIEESPKQGDHPLPTDANPLADLYAYKARPLNGIWATAPYLHNGSVPSLYTLLLPPEARPAQFTVGRWTYDPKEVGYVYQGEGPFVFDATVPGNTNVGHLYGTTLTEAQRWALVEYLKTL